MPSAHRYAYRVRSSGGTEKYVVAPSQAAAAGAMLSQEGEAASVDCLLVSYRIVRSGPACTVAVLPGWLSFIGQQCEHGGAHPGEASSNNPTQIEALLGQKSTASQEQLSAALLDSRVVMVNVEVIHGDGGPRVRIPITRWNGQDIIPVFTSEHYVPAEPGLRLSRHDFRLILKMMRPPRVPVVLNPRSAIEQVLDTDTLSSLQERVSASP